MLGEEEVFGHKEESLPFKGMTEEEYLKLKYYLGYCIEFSEDIKNLFACYEKGILTLKGIFLNRIETNFECKGYFNEDAMTLFVVSTIKYPDGEEIYTTDTFKFLGDTITVTSHTDELGDNVIEIPYYASKLKR